jgi:hypothetical protein
MKKQNSRTGTAEGERGNILVIASVALFSVFGFASIAIDVGCLLTAKNQLQSAVDASALAGASGLIVDTAEAVSRAVTVGGMNTCLQDSVLIRSGDVDFPATDRIRVRAERDVATFFAKVFGIRSVRISARAVAELGTVIGTGGMRPWGVPDMNWPRGTPVVVKSGSLGAPATNPSFYYPIDFPSINRGDPETGAQTYSDNIINGTSFNVAIGDVLLVEPGNMVGPTRQGVNALIAMDPSACWGGTQIVSSAYPGTSSPRIVKIPLYDPDLPPDSGRNTIQVTGLASFFITGIHGGDVIGIFMEKITSGQRGNGNSLLKGVRLVS